MSKTDKRNRFTVLIDMDGVCAEIHDYWLELYNKDYDDNLSPDQVVSWDLHKYVKEDCGLKIYEYLKEPGFFLGAPVVEGCAKSLRTLKNEGLNIILVTATPNNSPTAHYEKVKWVSRNLPFLNTKNFVSTSRKDLVRGDLLLDDAVHNLDSFTGIPCAFRRPWNLRRNYRFSIETWPQFTELALSLAKMGEGTIIDSEGSKQCTK
jgi:5'(3')-deoxyribonucleotidase